MADAALIEIQNLSSTATMALICVGGILYFLCDFLGGLLSCLFTWIHKKIKEDKRDNV